MPTEQDTNQDFTEAVTGTDDPGPLVLSLRLLRQFGAFNGRPDVADFLRANTAESETRMVQITSSLVQFV